VDLTNPLVCQFLSVALYVLWAFEIMQLCPFLKLGGGLFQNEILPKVNYSQHQKFA